MTKKELEKLRTEAVVAIPSELAAMGMVSPKTREALLEFARIVRQELDAHSEIRAFINGEWVTIPAKNEHLLKDD